MEFGVHSSLYSNCHNHINFAKFNLKVHYPPPYEWKVWYYQKANVYQIRKAVVEFPWENRFANISANEQEQLIHSNHSKYNLITIPIKPLPVMTEIHHV